MFTGAMAIMRVVQYTKQAVQATIELDSAMTQLQIVTRSTDSEMQAYADSITAVANKTASSVKDMVDMTTTFSRLGYSLEDSFPILLELAESGREKIAEPAKEYLSSVAFGREFKDVEDAKTWYKQYQELQAKKAKEALKEAEE